MLSPSAASNKAHGEKPAEKSKSFRVLIASLTLAALDCASAGKSSIWVIRDSKLGSETTESTPEPSTEACHHSLGIVARVCQPIPLVSVTLASRVQVPAGVCIPDALHSGMFGRVELGIDVPTSPISIDAPSEPQLNPSILFLSILKGLPPPAIANTKLLNKKPENASTNTLRQSSSSSPNLTSLMSDKLAAPDGPKLSKEMPGIAPSAKPPIASTNVSMPPGISRSENASVNLIFGNCNPPGEADKSPVLASTPPSAN